MSVEAMKQALEALETCEVAWPGTRFKSKYFDEDKVPNAITSLRQALSEAQLSVNENSHAIEQAEKQKPVTWLAPRYEGGHENLEVADQNEFGAFPVYTAPQPQREWVGLTDAEIEEFDYYARDLVMDIEKALKEKNNVT